jgi:hypothetical protein
MATMLDQLPDELDRRFNDMGWGLLLLWTGVAWLLPAGSVPPGTWLFGVAAVLLGVNVARYASRVAVSGFSAAIGLAALVAAISQFWRTDPPLIALFLVVIGASVVLKPFLAKPAK